MADPLSVSASLVGLMTLAAQVSQMIGDVVQRAQDAPKHCQSVREEVDGIRTLLDQLRVLLLGSFKPSRSRTSLIMVNQVVTVLAACVSTFNELDELVHHLASDQRMNLLDRLRWLSKQDQMTALLDKLETHKSSLGLMLAILTCQKQNDAEDKVDRLCELVDRTLEQNQHLAQRLAMYEVDEDAPSTAKTQPKIHDLASNANPPAYTASDPNEHKFTFEEQLTSSRPYRKIPLDAGDTLSLLSAGGHTGSWSMLSGLSLSDLSNVAIVALPVYHADVQEQNVYCFGDSMKHFNQENKTTPSTQQAARKVFGQSIESIYPYAHASVSLRNEEGQAVVYGYLPKVVVYLGAFIKEHGKQKPDIFATDGHAGRISVLEEIFDSPATRYGSEINASTYTAYDAASLLLRYLKLLPEPIIPFEHYPGFIKAMQDVHASSADDLSTETARFSSNIAKFQWQIQGLPHFHRQLLVYVLNLISLLALFSVENHMTASRLIALFQPALLSAAADMDASEHKTAADAIVFLVENEEHFLSDSWVALSKNTLPTKV